MLTAELYFVKWKLPNKTEQTPGNKRKTIRIFWFIAHEVVLWHIRTVVGSSSVHTSSSSYNKQIAKKLKTLLKIIAIEHSMFLCQQEFLTSSVSSTDIMFNHLVNSLRMEPSSNWISIRDENHCSNIKEDFMNAIRMFIRKLMHVHENSLSKPLV